MLHKKNLRWLIVMSFFVTGCGSANRVMNFDVGRAKVGLYLPASDGTSDNAYSKESKTAEIAVKNRPVKGEFLLEAHPDEDREMVVQDKINASVISARFTNKAVREGIVEIEFVVHVPGSLVQNDFRLGITPILAVNKDTLALDKILLSGQEFRNRQLAANARYEHWAEKIKSDSSAFLNKKMLDHFLERNIPQAYALKDIDEEYYLDEEFNSFFGVNSKEASAHYLNKLRLVSNNRRSNQASDMRKRFIKYSLRSSGVRIDSVLNNIDEDFIYRYKYDLKVKRGYNKANLFLNTELYNYDDNMFFNLEPSDSLIFYISSISALLDESISKKFDSNYNDGLQALKDMDYDKAADILRPYKDMNTALAMIAIGNNYTAREILEHCEPSANVDYLLAIVYSRFGLLEKAKQKYLSACRLNSNFVFRGNLDPEISKLKKLYDLDKILTPENI